MKKKIFFLVSGILLLSAVSLTMFGFRSPASVPNSAPNSSLAPEISHITIHCSALGTSDYVTIRYKLYTSDCEGYSPDWIDVGTIYFNSAGYVSYTTPYQCGYIIAQYTIHKAGAQCEFSSSASVGYHYPPDCNPNVLNLVIDVSYPWACPE